MNRQEIKDYFGGKLNEYAMIDSKLHALREKMKDVDRMEADTLIQINMGLAIFSVSQETAYKMLEEAIAVEIQYRELMYSRFMLAVGALNGELDNRRS